VSVVAHWAGLYVGLPWASGGRARPALDCGGLVRLVYAEQAGIIIEDQAGLSPLSLRPLARGLRALAAGPPWLPALGEPKAFDVALMAGVTGGKSAPLHLGLFVGPDMILHSEEATGAVLARASGPLCRHRVLGLYRHSDLASNLPGLKVP
jgi:cell wall-associated NlpC family hydrolase